MRIVQHFMMSVFVAFVVSCTGSWTNNYESTPAIYIRYDALEPSEVKNLKLEIVSELSARHVPFYYKTTDLTDATNFHIDAISQHYRIFVTNSQGLQIAFYTQKSGNSQIDNLTKDFAKDLFESLPYFDKSFVQQN